MAMVDCFQNMSEQLRMVTCGWCETKVFISGDLAASGDRAVQEVRASDHDAADAAAVRT